MQQRFRQATQEYPLPIGAGFLVAGLLAGLLLPRSAPEDELLGETADRIKDQTRAKGEEMVEKGKSMAASAAATTMEEAQARGVGPVQQLLEKAAGLAGPEEEPPPQQPI